jgi:hypothetical protein
MCGAARTRSTSRSGHGFHNRTSQAFELLLQLRRVWVRGGVRRERAVMQEPTQDHPQSGSFRLLGAVA